jgi:transposase-like protein
MAKNPFRYFKTSPEIIQLGVLMYVRFPLSLRGIVSGTGLEVTDPGV